jgi:hypothetical protein
MRPFRKGISAGAMLGLFILLGCDDSTGTKASDSPVGTWKGIVADSTLTVVLKSDSKFTAVLPNEYGTYQMGGSYSIAGNAITLQYASSLQGEEGIPPPSPNPAIGTLSGTSMKISAPYRSEGDSTTLKKQ